MSKKVFWIFAGILFIVIVASFGKLDVNDLVPGKNDLNIENKSIFEIKNSEQNSNSDDNSDDNQAKNDNKSADKTTAQNDEATTKKDNKNEENVSNESTKDVTSGESSEASNVDVDVVPVSSSALSNTTCAWGFRRMKDEVQPEFSASYTKPLDEYDGIYVGNKDNRVIYLTFDEGYENGYTATILDTLKEKGVEATFFVTMPYVKQNPELVQRMIDEGHIVGNHTVNHPSMPSVLDDEKLKKEVTGLHDYVLEKFNYEMKYLRPPKGEYSERTVKLCRDLGYTNVLWSFAYDDWDVKKQDRLDYDRKMIYNNLHNGCVMLLHAVSKDNDALLGEFIETAWDRGFEFCSLDDFERWLFMGKNDFREKLEKALEMPVELLNNYPRITVLGNESVFIENYKAILDYEENLIRVSNNISIYGEKLNVAEITADDMLVSGKIKSIEFE